MELKIFLTYIGLLFTAYNINPEYKKIQLKLSLKIWKIIFFLTIFLLFISSNKWIKYQLIQELHIKTYFNHWIWVSKYHLIVILNFFSLYKIFTATQLNKNNSKIFFELVKNFEVEKKYDLKSKLIKENLENIFEYKNYNNFLFKIQNKIYNFISPHSSYLKRIEKGIDAISKLQKKYLDNGGDFNKLNEIGKLPNTKYTKIEKFRKSLAKPLKLKPLRNYFPEIYNFVLDKKFINYIIKNDEQFGIEILHHIAKYRYFSESYEYIEYFLKKTLSNKKSLTFKYLYNNDNKIEFIKENQNYENGFDLGLLICKTIEKLIIKNRQKLQKIYLSDCEDRIYKHISNLYEILKQLDTDKMHLDGTPYYIQKELINIIDFSIDNNNQNLAFHILLEQLYTMKELALKIQNKDFIEHNFDNLLEDLLKIKNINQNIALEFALYYADYIFDKYSKIDIKIRIENFEKFIDKINNQFIIELYLKVFDKSRSYNGKDYSSYTKTDKDLQNYWNEICIFLKAKEE